MFNIRNGDPLPQKKNKKQKTKNKKKKKQTKKTNLPL